MIPYGRQSIDEDDIAAVVASLRSDWLTQGPAVQQFENELAAKCGAKYAVACNSGTAALHMAYAAAGIGPGDTVVVPANTFLATANAAIYLGAEVRFCDVDPLTGLMTPELLAPHLDDYVRAVVPVHFAGQPCEMEEIVAISARLAPGAVVIEDASHALGGRYLNGVSVGTPKYASMITFSFHPVKHIAAGEGGAVTTDCPMLKKKLESFRCHGIARSPLPLVRKTEGPWYYEMQSPGFNYRIPDLNCALAASQLNKLDRFVSRRREIAKAYIERLQDVPGIKLPMREHLDTSAWHLFCLHVDFSLIRRDRATVMAALLQNGVGTQVHYFPVSLQPYYQHRYGLTEKHYPGSVRHYSEALSIPMFPAMSNSEISQVIDCVRMVLSKTDRKNKQVA